MTNQQDEQSEEQTERDIIHLLRDAAPDRLSEAQIEERLDALHSLRTSAALLAMWESGGLRLVGCENGEPRFASTRARHE